MCIAHQNIWAGNLYLYVVPEFTILLVHRHYLKISKVKTVRQYLMNQSQGLRNLPNKSHSDSGDREEEVT